MELLYLCTYEIDNDASLGVWKKMAAQRKVFSKYYNVSYTYMRDHHFWIRKGENETDLGELKFIGRIYCLRLLLNYYKKIGQVPNYMYVRYTMSDWNVIKLLNYLKSKGTKTIIEIPTYPYETECKDSVQDYVSLLIDRCYRVKIKIYVRNIVSYGDIPSRIYGVETTQITNGVDAESIRARSYIEHGNVINLIGVAAVSKWHGYDRILSGLKEYYENDGKRQIHFNIIGDGPALVDYKKYVEEEHIGKYVTFCGVKKGKELDDYFDISDIAVSSLGIHRIGITGAASTLKAREYAVRGIPIITSNEIDILSSKKYNFILKVPVDDSAININELVTFYNTITNPKELAKFIRTIGIQQCGMDKAMYSVIRLFENNM